MATVNQDAEAKLLEALAVSETKMVPVQVEKEVTGRLPMDDDPPAPRAARQGGQIRQPSPAPRRRGAVPHVDNVTKLEAELAQLEADAQRD